MNPQARQKFLIILTVSMVVLWAGVNFVVDPLTHWWQARNAEIQDLHTRLTDGRLLVTRSATLRSEWSDMQANALPPVTSSAEQQLLRALEGWTRDAGVEVSSITPQWRADSTNYMTLTCRVETTGDMGTLTRFLADLENASQAIRLDAVELGAHDTAGHQLTMSVDIDGLALGAKEVVK